jgi:hypothetical protein
MRKMRIVYIVVFNGIRQNPLSISFSYHKRLIPDFVIIVWINAICGCTVSPDFGFQQYGAIG